MKRHDATWPQEICQRSHHAGRVWQKLQNKSSYHGIERLRDFHFRRVHLQKRHIVKSSFPCPLSCPCNRSSVALDSNHFACRPHQPRRQYRDISNRAVQHSVPGPNPCLAEQSLRHRAGRRLPDGRACSASVRAYSCLPIFSRMNPCILPRRFQQQAYPRFHLSGKRSVNQMGFEETYTAIGDKLEHRARSLIFVRKAAQYFSACVPYLPFVIT